MCEYLERMRIKGTATEDIRLWSGYAHRVVELTGPSPTTDDVSVYLWLHKDSASLLLDMCDEIDSRFDALQEENEKLRELSKYAILCSEGDARCLGCPYHDKEAESYSICAMRKAAIELGIEVSK